MKKSKKQPKPKKGDTFISWAVYNWGFCYQKTFRTRKQAHEYCWKNGRKRSKGKLIESTCWNDVKDHMAVVKVKCKVIF